MSTREYLEALKWDGKPRIATFFTDYVRGAEDERLADIAMKWFVASVARAITPGCQLDQILILCGPQGSGKTGLLRALFGNTVVDWSNKNKLEDLSTRWAIEVPVYFMLGQHLGFWLQTSDIYRPRGQLCATMAPRSCIIVGSTEDGSLFTEESRRFRVVTVTEVATNKISADRDQLWAEAKNLFYSGTQWWD